MNRGMLPRSLLAGSTGPEDVLSLYLGREIEEIVDWADSPDVMLDGLPRETCHQAVVARCEAMCGDRIRSLSVAELISTIVPLAETIEEVDGAIRDVLDWFERLTTDRLFERIVDAKSAAEDGRGETPDDLEEAGCLAIRLGGRSALFSVESSCIMAMVQMRPQGDDYVVLYCFDHASDEDDGDDGWSRDPEGDGPHPEPTRPALEPA